jgi:hypothetical protein
MSLPLKRMLRNWLLFFAAWFGTAAVHALITGRKFNPMLDRSFTYIFFAAYLLGTIYRFWADMQDSRR